jgi:hypothetical protein
MAYTIGLILFDLGGVYPAGSPTLAGVLDAPALGAPSTATSTAPPFAITFASPPNPPGSPGTLLLTDSSGPGDFFRSGPITTWPAEPVSVQVGAGVAALTYAQLSAGLATPISIGIPADVALGIGAATGFMFTPLNITIRSITLGLSPTPNVIRARFSGTMGYTTFIVPRRTDFTGTVDLTITPSGNASVPATIVNVSTTNLSLSTGFTTPLSLVVINLFAPVFSGALSGPLTTSVNTALAGSVATLRAMLPTLPDGTSLFSPAATVSVRRIAVLSSGVIVHGILAELVSTATTTPPGTTPTNPGVEGQFLVTIDPAPEMDVAHTYIVGVRQASDSSPVADATVSIRTFTGPFRRPLVVSTQTNMAGTAELDVTLRFNARLSSDPDQSGQLVITWPSLTVTKAGFQPYTQELLGPSQEPDDG